MAFVSLLWVTARLPVVYRGAWEVSYVPGHAELPWVTDNATLRRTCLAFSHPSYTANHTACTATAKELWLNPSAELRSVVEPSSLMSQMVYCPRGSGLAELGGGPGCRVEPIEPLTPTARHPFARVGCAKRADAYPEETPAADVMQARIMDISHLVLTSACDAPGSGGRGRQASDAAAPARAVNPGQALFFDAGCAVWHGSNKPPNPRRKEFSLDRLRGAGMGPSLPLFSTLYGSRCIRFDRLFGWEAKTYDPKEWWRFVPLEQAVRLSFVNHPISVGGAFDPLLAISSVAKEEDYVAFKLDVDTWHLERALVEELLTNSRGTNASALVDEFFFEYHFQHTHEPQLHRFWGSGRGGSLEDAMATMFRLRENGIRAHFWI